MVIKLSPELEIALTETARLQGVPPDVLANIVLSERLLPQLGPTIARDEWERRVLSLASDCGTSLPDWAVGSEGAYE